MAKRINYVLIVCLLALFFSLTLGHEVLWSEEISVCSSKTPIMGEPEASVSQAQKWAQSRDAHQRFIDIAPTYWKYGRLMGIRPEVLYAQSAKETAFGRYGGVVEPYFNNWAGIKTAEGGPCDCPDAHEKFDTPEDGVRGHFNHIGAYVGIDPVGEPHGRYYVVLTTSWAGTIKYVEELGGRWAPSSTYGESVVNDYLRGLLRTEILISVKSKNRIFGKSRYQTAVEISREAFSNSQSAEAVVLTRGDDFPDALAGSSFAYHSNGPLLLTPADRLHDDAAAEIERVLQPDGTIYILGGDAAISAEVQDEIEENFNHEVKRLAGDNRYETAVKVGEKFLENKEGGFPVFMATGENFPDALTVASAAANRGGIILLSSSSSLDVKTAEFLVSHEDDLEEVYVVGGTSALSEEVYEESGAGERIAGNNRWETAVKLAERFFEGPSNVTIASGLDFPDALSGGAYAAILEAPMLLAGPTDMPLSVVDYLKSLSSDLLPHVYIFGGANAIGEEIMKKMEEK